MILQTLHALYDRLASEDDYGIAPAGHSIQKISFRVMLHPDGRLFEIQEVFRTDNGRKRPRQLAVLGDGKPSGSGINPRFLWDNTGYMLGYKPDDPKQSEEKQAKVRERSRQCCEGFCQHHLAVEAAIGSPAFSAVCRFLEGWSPEQALEACPALADYSTGFGVFQILGQTAFVHQDPAVLAWWRRQTSAESDSPMAQCLITGEVSPVARLHPMIKGVAGGKAVKPMVSFNKDAYESYGKGQSYNAPVSEEAAVRYGAALNALLDGPKQAKHRFLLGDATVAFWTDLPSITEDVFVAFMGAGASAGAERAEAQAAQDAGQLLRLHAFLAALRKGNATAEAPKEGSTPFCILGLSSNAARISVRLFHRGTVAGLLDNLRQHFQDIGSTPRPAQGKRSADPEFPPAWLLLAQTARETKDIPPLLAAPLLKAIITGAKYPQGLVDAVLRRIRADRTISYPRVCVLKGYLVRNLEKEVPMSLDIANPEPAYRLGRLFAALEKTQLDALPGINATIRDRFYSAASATPGVVFPRLLRTYQHHLSKLTPGGKVNREKLVQEIVSSLIGFPQNLSLADQGLFAIGYYHQTQDFYTAKDKTAKATDNQ